MGAHANRPATRAAAWACALLVGALNVVLLWRQFLG
jgi:Mn2+/Fe2+ NRAMP family transporter